MVGVYVCLVAITVVFLFWARSMIFPRIWLFWLLVIACVVGLAVVGLMLSSIGFYWPAPPEVNMCNAELMWNDMITMIINTVTSGKASVESELLITVYNPNRLGGTIAGITGNIFYKAAPVGTINIGEIDLVPGSATDSLGVLTFNGFDKISEMYYDFNILHKLLLEFELFISLNLGDFELSTVMTKFAMNINDPPVQKHCKCDYKSTSQSGYEFDML